MNELKEFLDEKVSLYNTIDFIETDPIQIPHRYELKEDIEIAGFFAATIAWGNRKMIINNANKIMDIMGNSPYDFVMNAPNYRVESIEGFAHRTFNSSDLISFIKNLRHIYTYHGGLEGIFTKYQTEHSLQPAISQFKKLFFEMDPSSRAGKHISDPENGSAAKRINMMLRWFCRKDKRGVDFGIWKNISPSKLSCPLDVHSGNVARQLGILTRKQNDSKALNELDTALRMMDPIDPVKYDFALFGLGVFEKFNSF